MKLKTTFFTCLLLAAAQLPVFAQGTAFTYQGRLNSAGGPANGTYDFEFAVFDKATNTLANASPIVPLVTSIGTPVSNGLFTVTLDFGTIFTGTNLWLDISVRTNGGASFTELAPSQAFNPTPYAITAENIAPGAGLAGTYGGAVTLTNAANSFTGNGTNLINVNAATLNGLAATNFWQLSGNNVASGQALGSTNNQPVEIRANNLTAMRYAYASNSVNHASANVIGGSSLNFVSNGVVGATIVGGGAVAQSNSVTADFGTVVGGAGNTAGGAGSLAGGIFSTASGFRSVALGSSVASGGFSVALGNATASGDNSFAAGTLAIASGRSSFAGGNHSTASGLESVALGEADAEGEDSVALGAAEADGDYSMALGLGWAQAPFSFAAGSAVAVDPGSFVWGDRSTVDDIGSSSSNQFIVRASGGFGINTRSPHANMLTVATANGAYGMEQTDGNIRVGTYVGGSTGGGWMGTISNHRFSLYVNSGPPTLTLNTNGLVGIGTTTPSSALQVVGTVTATTFNPSSDRNIKENFTPISPREVLDKVATLPISQWNFKQDATVPHLGPMAQDFYAAFALGSDDKHIATVDESGVALAAIQGLNEKMQEKDAEIQKLQAAVEELKQALNELKHSH